MGFIFQEAKSTEKSKQKGKQNAEKNCVWAKNKIKQIFFIQLLKFVKQVTVKNCTGVYGTLQLVDHSS